MTDYAEVYLTLKPEEKITKQQFNDLMVLIRDEWEPEGQFEGNLFEEPYEGDDE